MPLLIHCTQKLLAEIPERFIDASALGGGWHANLLRLERRKCVLFTHDETLYSVFVPGLRKPEFERLDKVFGQRLFKALLWDAFPQAQIERMLEACRVIRFTRSRNRSVLASWKNTIKVQRLDTSGMLADNPSLQGQADDIVRGPTKRANCWPPTKQGSTSIVCPNTVPGPSSKR